MNADRGLVPVVGSLHSLVGGELQKLGRDTLLHMLTKNSARDPGYSRYLGKRDVQWFYHMVVLCFSEDFLPL